MRIFFVKETIRPEVITCDLSQTIWSLIVIQQTRAIIGLDNSQLLNQPCIKPEATSFHWYLIYFTYTGNHMHYFIWDVITPPCFELLWWLWQLMISHTPWFYVDVIPCPWHTIPINSANFCYQNSPKWRIALWLHMKCIMQQVSYSADIDIKLTHIFRTRGINRFQELFAENVIFIVGPWYWMCRGHSCKFAVSTDALLGAKTSACGVVNKCGSRISTRLVL